MLFIPDSNIHWGDPGTFFFTVSLLISVNTSSKLGEDLAQGGVIYISMPAYQALEENFRGDLLVRKHAHQLSSADLTCMEILGNTQYPPLPRDDLFEGGQCAINLAIPKNVDSIVAELITNQVEQTGQLVASPIATVETGEGDSMQTEEKQEEGQS